MAIFRNDKKKVEKWNDNNAQYSFDMFQTGEQFPPPNSIERIAKYKRMKKIFEGKNDELYERASAILKDTPHAKSLRSLYIGVNIADIIVTKAADLLVGEPPSFKSGFADGTEEQEALDSYVEENDLVKLIHESATGNGYRGDSWIKPRYGYRHDYSELAKLGVDIPYNVVMEPIVEHVSAEHVFPETARGNIKQFKAVNIAQVEYVVSQSEEVPFLNIERHIPGYIIYARYRLHEREGGVDNSYGYPVQTYLIGKKVATGREEDIVETGVPIILPQHVPYKSVDDDWQGVGGIEKMESLLAAINDRLVQIDYILWKHSDPTGYGPPILDGEGATIQFGGRYIPVNKDEVSPGYMTWDGHLDAAFKELEVLIALAFQMAETPQWLFGTVLGQNTGGTGTSHTDNGAIKARFMPILSKVKRIRTQYDKAMRDILWICSMLDVQHGEKKFQPFYPSINWQDGIPKNEKELAEIMAIRTNNKPTIDVRTAVEIQDGVDGEEAEEIIERIKQDEKDISGFVEPSIFNEE